MTWYYRWKTLKTSVKKSVELIHAFGKVVGYKINIQKPVTLQYTNNKLSEKLRNNSISNASERLKYLGINLTKEMWKTYTLKTIGHQWKKLIKTQINEKILHTHRLEKLRCPYSVQFSSVVKSCPTLCNHMNHSTPGFPVHLQLQAFTQTHVHWVGDTIQPSHPLSSPSPPAPNPSQHQSLFQWVNSSHEVAKVLEFQLQHQSFQWTPRTDLL